MSESIASSWATGFTYHDSALNLADNQRVECKVINTLSNYLKFKLIAFKFLADSDSL